MSRRARPGCVRGERGRHLRCRLAARHGARCFYCRRPAPPAALTFDHYIPYRLWPTYRPVNLVLACGPCNERKADRLPLLLALLLLATVAHLALTATTYPPGDYAGCTERTAR